MTPNNEYFAIKIHTRAFVASTNIPRKYVGYYDTCSRVFKDFFSRKCIIKTRLSHKIIDTLTLVRYHSGAINYDLQNTSPNYQLVFQHKYNYYAESLVSFTNSADKLLVQYQIF